jgi:hypothetical protein
MAWEYQITRLATSTVTSTTWAASGTSSGSTSQMTSAGTVRSVTNLASSGGTEGSSGTTAFLGTGSGRFSVSNTAGTTTFWQSWQIETWTSSRTASSTSSALATVGTTRTVLTGTGGTKRESSYVTLYGVTLVTETGVDGFFTDGFFRTALTLQTFATRTEISFEDATGGIATVTNTFSGQTTEQFSFSNNSTRTWSYNSGTASTTANTTATVTTTSNKSYTFVASTTGPGTTTASSTYLVTTSQTLATTTSSRSYVEGTFNVYRVLDSVIHCDSSDWGWSSTVTTDSEGQISNIAASFTGDITIPMRAIGLPLTWTPVSESYSSSVGVGGVSAGATTSWQDTFLTTQSTTANFTLRTTQLETYTIGAGTSASNLAPLTSQTTISRTITTTTNSVFTFHITTTTAFGVSSNQPGWKSAVLFSYLWTITLSSTRTGFDVPTYTTTAAGGAVYGTNDADTLNSTASTTSSASNATITTHGTTRNEVGKTLSGNPDRDWTDQTAGHEGTYDRMNFAWSAVSATPPSFVAAAIAGGFQAWGSEGRGQSYYQNLAGGGIPILSFGHIYPNIRVPLMDNLTRAFTAGTITATSQYVESANHVLLTQQTGTHTSETVASTVTHTIVITASQGIHRYTLMDSAGATSTGFISWNATNSTFTIPYAHALAIETVAKGKIYRTQMTTDISPVSIFSAFPNP